MASKVTNRCRTPYGFGTNVTGKLDTYEPFVNMAMAANHIKV
ncbi:hypothetical protein [Bacillus sp. AF56]